MGRRPCQSLVSLITFSIPSLVRIVDVKNGVSDVWRGSVFRQPLVILHADVRRVEVDLNHADGQLGRRLLRTVPGSKFGAAITRQNMKLVRPVVVDLGKS